MHVDKTGGLGLEQAQYVLLARWLISAFIQSKNITYFMQGRPYDGLWDSNSDSDKAVPKFLCQRPVL